MPVECIYTARKVIGHGFTHLARVTHTAIMDGSAVVKITRRNQNEYNR
jgi:hypothetical protein